MELKRDRWTPLTIVIETPEEAEVLHKVLARINGFDVSEDIDLYGLFVKLGEGLTHDRYECSGEIVISLA